MTKTAITLGLLLALLCGCQISEPPLEAVELHPLSTAWEKDESLPHTFRIGAGDLAWVALGCDPGRPHAGIRLHVRSVRMAPMRVTVVPAIPLDESAGAIGEYRLLLGHDADPNAPPKPVRANEAVHVEAGFYANLTLRSDYFIRPYPVRDGSGFAFDLVVASGNEREVLPVKFHFSRTGPTRITPWSQ